MNGEDLEAFFEVYREKLMAILKQPASRKNHTNVLMHIQGYFRDQLNSRQRGELREVILNYRAGLLPILAPLTLLKHYLAEYPDRYLQAQNYFDPLPAGSGPAPDGELKGDGPAARRRCACAGLGGVSLREGT